MTFLFYLSHFVTHISENLIRRSPSFFLEESIAVEALETKFAKECSEPWTCAPRADSKSVWRVDACEKPGTHSCHAFSRGESMNSNLLDLRSNHFYVRTKADAYLHAEKWRKHDPISFYENGNAFHTSVQDLGLWLSSGQAIKKRIKSYLSQ